MFLRGRLQMLHEQGRKEHYCLVVLEHTLHLRTWEIETGGFLNSGPDNSTEFYRVPGQGLLKKSLSLNE